MALAERPDLAEHSDMALARRLALNPDSRQDLLIALLLHVENGWPQPVRANGSNQSTGGSEGAAQANADPGQSGMPLTAEQRATAESIAPT